MINKPINNDFLFFISFSISSCFFFGFFLSIFPCSFFLSIFPCSFFLSIFSCCSFLSVSLSYNSFLSIFPLIIYLFCILIPSFFNWVRLFRGKNSATVFGLKMAAWLKCQKKNCVWLRFDQKASFWPPLFGVHWTPWLVLVMRPKLETSCVGQHFN